MLKSYHEPDGSLLIDGPESETGGDARKLGLLLPQLPPTLFATMTEAGLTLPDDQIRKLLDDPNRKSGRKRFDPSYNKNQGPRGSCNGYALAGALKRARVRRGLEYIDLSGDYAYSCMNGGRDGGSHLEAGMKLCMIGGTCTEALVKQLGLVHEYRNSRFPAECKQEALRFLGFECYRTTNERELATACALGFDCVVPVQAGGDGSLDANGVVKWGNGPGNHSVLVDDAVYDTRIGRIKFDDDNSWGTRWGDQGRCFLVYERHFRTSFGYHHAYAIRSTSDDPQGDNPPTPKPKKG